MIEEHLSLVRFVAEKFHRRLPPGIDLESLVQAGISGLLHAIERDKTQRSGRVHAFVKYRVQSEVAAYLRSLDWVSRAVRTWGRREGTARRQLTERLTREAQPAEIATELDISVEEYERIMAYDNESHLLSREALAASSEEEWAQVQTEFLARPSQDPLLFLRDPAVLEVVRGMLGTFSQQERLVMTLAHYEEMTPREISEILDITEERVCQIHRDVMVRLQQRLHVEKA